jgi:hypothetical protein
VVAVPVLQVHQGGGTAQLPNSAVALEKRLVTQPF